MPIESYFAEDLYLRKGGLFSTDRKKMYESEVTIIRINIFR